MKNREVLFHFIFNINSIISSAILALIVNIIPINCATSSHLMPTVQTAETGYAIICSYNTKTLAFGTFHLNPSSSGTIGEIRFINYSAHALVHTFLYALHSHSKNIWVSQIPIFCRILIPSSTLGPSVKFPFIPKYRII